MTNTEIIVTCKVGAPMYLKCLMMHGHHLPSIHNLLFLAVIFVKLLSTSISNNNKFTKLINKLPVVLIKIHYLSFVSSVLCQRGNGQKNPMLRPERY